MRSNIAGFERRTRDPCFRSFGRAFAETCASVNLRLGDLPLAGEEVEVAAFVGLSDMGGEHGAVAAHVVRRRRLPGRAAARKLLVADMQVDAAGRPRGL